MNTCRTLRQKGAALIVALILLIALSLLAISSMNTATLDLIMTGNEQYRARAFSAAEAGINAALLSNDFSYVNVNTSKTGTGDIDPNKANTNYNDSYEYTIRFANKGIAEPVSYNSSEGAFGAVYYQIESNGKTGNSERDSTAKITQEVYEIVRASNEVQKVKDQCSGSNGNIFSTCTTN